jgi:hypothetical protein
MKIPFSPETVHRHTKERYANDNVLFMIYQEKQNSMSLTQLRGETHGIQQLCTTVTVAEKLDCVPIWFDSP